ncbi:hypothetical protein [Clavibacter michiganensis]|uniref:hypothetical protein n=1 Tax=Clavibacter michiganensis TaxID=28447 RepID=UPI003EB83167
MTRSPHRLPARGAALSAAVTVGVMLLAGCSSTSVACAASAWNDSVEIRLSGSATAVDRVTEVRLCEDDVCSRLQGDPSGAPADGEPDERSRWVAIPSSDGRTWTISVSMDDPEDVRITGSAADGAILDSAEEELEWTRVYPDSPCDGPHVTDPVELRVEG